MPITNRLDIALPSLAKLIRCNCKITSKNPCGSRVCTCVKYGMPCLPSCAGCRGEECQNTKEVTQEQPRDDMSDEPSGSQQFDNIFDILNSQFYNDST